MLRHLNNAHMTYMERFHKNLLLMSYNLDSMGPFRSEIVLFR